MNFKSDSQRKAVFFRLNNKFSLKESELRSLMKEHSDALESAKKMAIIDPKKKIVVESPSLESKDGNCFQRSREHGRFALKYDPKTRMVISDEYPDVNVLLISRNPGSVVEKLRAVPEQHLSGIEVIESDRYMGVPEDTLGNYMYLNSFPTSTGSAKLKSSFIKLRPDEEIYFYHATHPDYTHNKPVDILAHEIGHHVMFNNLGLTAAKGLGRMKSEMLADRYMEEQTGGKTWYDPETGSEERLDDAHAYLETLQEAKTPSIKDMIKQAKLKESDFSHDDRKRSGWYPRDSNLPEDFDGMVRTFTFEAIGRFPIFDPNSKADVSKVTSDVCMELDQIWKPEWGKRPAGRYVRADVEDALEDLI